VTTTVRDTARRCARCERVTLGCHPLWIHEGKTVVDVALLCTRCRSELKPLLVEVLRESTVRESTVRA
jgi:hypothetical protein